MTFSEADEAREDFASVHDQLNALESHLHFAVMAKDLQTVKEHLKKMRQRIEYVLGMY